MTRAMFAAVALILLSSLRAMAQEPGDVSDSLIFTRNADVDTALVGKSVIATMPENVRVLSDAAVQRALEANAQSGTEKKVSGFRIRIFFDNSQNARNESQAVAGRFKARYQDAAVYRTFESPYFKVTVGDYRTRSEALAALRRIQVEFPSAFIVKEKLKYPQLPGTDTYKVDTLKVYRNITL